MLLESEIPSYHVATPIYKGAENFRDANTLGVLKTGEGLIKEWVRILYWYCTVT